MQATFPAATAVPSCRPLPSSQTFTITGGTERYADRGMIPRAISALFAEAGRRSDHSYTVHVSYLVGAGLAPATRAHPLTRGPADCATAGTSCRLPLPLCLSQEIYNETGFDLLEPSREVRALEDLPKVRCAGLAERRGRRCRQHLPACCPPCSRASSAHWRCRRTRRRCQVSIQEDEEGRMHTRNLSLHRCDIEEQALNMVGGAGGAGAGGQRLDPLGPPPVLHPSPSSSAAGTRCPAPPSTVQLFLGDTNRVVAETPLNQASSRSHAVFTLHLEARRGDEARRRRSKLHFVDLAGSERVGKTGLAAHTQLKEAKYINLSLHFLEQV